MKNTGASLFTDYQNLMRVWTHPWMFKLEEKRKEKQVTCHILYGGDVVKKWVVFRHVSF